MVSFIFTGCTTQKNQASGQADTNMQRIYVDSYDCRETLTKSEVLEVQVSGNLPSPAYSFSRFDVTVGGGVIEITPLATYNPNKIVAQMLVPFEQTCQVEGLKVGTYEVKVISRGGAPVSGHKVRVTP
ncbi:hypothetical protein MJD09_25000 [bacterium]|nr:hypothetical protein [bacterium]